MQETPPDTADAGGKSFVHEFQNAVACEWSKEKPSFIKNNVKDVDIYIGRNAGSFIIDDIKNAKKSIKIISPYLGLNKIKLLIESVNKGIDVKVITTDDGHDFKHPASSKLLRELIKQKPIDIENAKKHRKIFLVFFILFIISGIISILALIHFNKNFIYLLALYLVTFIFFIIRYKLWVIYKYEYYSVFPIIFVKKEKHKKNGGRLFELLHTKLYIIDGQDCYTGSINFSSSGMKYNFETRIKIKDNETRAYLLRYFNFLFDEKKWQKVDINNKLGKEIYGEPIN